MGKDRPSRSGSELIMSRSAITRPIALIAAAASAVAAIGRRRSESPAPAEAPEEPAEILADNSHVFDGLYEPLYQALRNDRDDQLQEVLNEWDIRARHADNRVNRAWRELARTGSVPLSEVTGQPVRELGTRLAAVVADAGIIRDDRTSFLIGEDDKRRYRFDQEPQTGTMAEVEIPCWTAGQHVAERGIAHQSTTSTTSS